MFIESGLERKAFWNLSSDRASLRFAAVSSSTVTRRVSLLASIAMFLALMLLRASKSRKAILIEASSTVMPEFLTT